LGEVQIICGKRLKGNIFSLKMKGKVYKINNHVHPLANKKNVEQQSIETY